MIMRWRCRAGKNHYLLLGVDARYSERWTERGLALVWHLVYHILIDSVQTAYR